MMSLAPRSRNCCTSFAKPFIIVSSVGCTDINI
ncbi:Uncharacterised protein [Segatella copri]|nr:Uncharacterised protein [Segatella copri]